MSQKTHLPHGIYELLITELIEERLQELSSKSTAVAVRDTVSSNESAKLIARHVERLVFDSLQRATTTEEQVQIANRVLQALQSPLPQKDQDWLTGGEVLYAIWEAAANAVTNPSESHPETGLNESTLFTGGNGGIALVGELRREIQSADRVDLLVSFIKWSGLVVLMAELEDLVQKRNGQLRVMTTSYMGASDAKAIEWLSQLPNTEVRVSYNSANERLHAKAYLFHRNTGFHTAYIGSSNFSRSALTTGLEWNLKVTARDSGHILDTFKATFQSYWASNEFEPFDADRDSTKLRKALTQGSNPQPASLDVFFDLTPHPFQLEILEALDVERKVHGRMRNLVVAATGTGKTMVAAFDFRRLMQAEGCKTLLFVCHREEILEQALRTYRAVLRDNNFGGLWVGGKKPSEYSAVFASVQTLNSQLERHPLSADQFDVVVVDEVHHITADSYRPVLNRFTPKVLLGLTATPERTDGANVLDDFGGQVAAEIRLPEAMNRGLLCPFHYFGVSDSVDLRRVTWERGRYQETSLSNVFTGNSVRVRTILDNLQRYTVNPQRVRALGFCVTIEHAEYMADAFTQAGLKAAALTSNTLEVDRRRLRGEIQRGDLAYLFVVDVFNEGVDLPEIDTVLFLRPTESLTVFMQQLGRGLRLHKDKDVVTVLDFVAASNANYDFAHKFRAMIGRSTRPLKAELERGFPSLPSGCSIVLERQARAHILENLSRATRFNRRALVNAIINFKSRTTLPLNLSNFIKMESLDVRELYRRKGLTFESLKAEAFDLPFDAEAAESLRKAMNSDWMALEDADQMAFIRDLATSRFSFDPSTASDTERMRALMVHWDVRGKSNPFPSLATSLADLGQNPALCDEVAAFMTLRRDQLRSVTHPIAPTLPNCPLQVHGVYSRSQIITALGFNTEQKFRESREGVAHNKTARVEALFVDLVKDEKRFSPSTLYHDYAISENLFHWQSQNKVAPDSPTGQRYIHHVQRGERIFLFLREFARDEHGRTNGYLFAGEAIYVEHEGSRPMSIVWSLSQRLPARLWRAAAKLRVG